MAGTVSDQGELTLHVLHPVRTFGLLALFLRDEETGRSGSRRLVALVMVTGRRAPGSVVSSM
jgi:hypothetical protein